MPLTVGLNGFGRIGRIILRSCFVRSNVEIIAINDPVVDIEYICYLIKFDSTHGKFKNEISYSNNNITINGKKIKVFHEKFPSSIPWSTLGVEYVVEASGMFSNMEKASGHLIGASVKCVLVTTPSVDIPMLILGVNEQQTTKDQRVISCASSTLYCLAPIVKILEDNYGVAEGFVTSIHAMTPSLKPLDGLCLKGRHWRDHRSIHQNIIPAATGACKALGKIIPAVNDKFCGLAFRVPIVNVSVIDITVRLNKGTNIRDIAAQIEKESKTKMKNIITTSYDEAVSSDFLNDENSCILDVNSSLELTPTSFKLICWYENEYSYACRVIDTIFFLHERFKSQEPTKSFVPVKLRSDPGCEAIKNRDAIAKSNKMFHTMSLGSGLRNQLHKKIPNTPIHSSHIKRHSHLYTEKSNNEEQTIKIIVYDDKSSPDVEEFSAQSSNIIENRERLEFAKKELAKIASKTEELLKETKYDKANTLDSAVLDSNSSDVTNFSDDNNIKTLVQSNNGDSSTDKEANVNHIESFLNILNVKNTHDVNAAIDIGDQIDAIHENTEVTDAESINQNTSLHNAEASSISERKTEDDTRGAITDKQTTSANNKDLRRASRSHEHFNYDKSESSINEQNDIVSPLKFSNKKHTKKNKSNVIEENNEINFENGLANTNSNNILLVSTCSLDSKKISLGPSDAHHRLQISDNRESKKQMIEKNILSSVLKTSKGDIMLPMFDSIKLISKRERIAKENLLDKLASETDSDYSFRTDETKSQVIDITDLSSSTDDLARVDKICRIIEISDELSDELFSALNINSETGKREWSFKELCEKIKLDDFCCKVFGQSI